MASLRAMPGSALSAAATSFAILRTGSSPLSSSPAADRSGAGGERGAMSWLRSNLRLRSLGLGDSGCSGSATPSTLPLTSSTSTSQGLLREPRPTLFSAQTRYWIRAGKSCWLTCSSRYRCGTSSSGRRSSAWLNEVMPPSTFASGLQVVRRDAVDAPAPDETEREGKDEASVVKVMEDTVDDCALRKAPASLWGSTRHSRWYATISAPLSEGARQSTWTTGCRTMPAPSSVASSSAGPPPRETP
mmetsp:Transcript_21984/g.67504  ORF Transcript_21984/g.67504 Transcript_21984/m.67504 type:complete len:245 (+) Transcript_21984:226-960(+)